MAKFLTLNEFVLKCRETHRVSELWADALDFFYERQIAMVSYHSDDPSKTGTEHHGIVSDGFPGPWVCEYMEKQLFKIDPIPSLASLTSRPFKWSDAPKLMKLDAEAKRYMEFLSASGLGDGLALQVFGPNLRNAYVGLGFGPKDPDLSAQEVFELQCAAQIAHIRYCELTADRLPQTDALSRREIEILQWIARGKSTSVIADILGISRHTVDTITRRIFEKLDVNDRTTAAIRGVGSGLVRHRRGIVA